MYTWKERFLEAGIYILAGVLCISVVAGMCWFLSIPDRKGEALAENATSGYIIEMGIAENHLEATEEIVYYIRVRGSIYHEESCLRNPYTFRKTFFVSEEIYNSYELEQYYEHKNMEVREDVQR